LIAEGTRRGKAGVVGRPEKICWCSLTGELATARRQLS
jgi:hypothetical protein